MRLMLASKAEWAAVPLLCGGVQVHFCIWLT
jgi:hypothetical protein